MTLDTLQAIVTIIGLPLAFLSVIALLFQNRQLAQSTKSQVYQGLIDNSLKIDALLIENPELRKYIYGGQPLPQDTREVDRLMAVLEFVNDIVDNLRAQEKYIPRKLRPGWRAFANDVTASPSMQHFMEAHGHWYAPPRKGPEASSSTLVSRPTPQSYLSPMITIRESDIHGLGMFATEPIISGVIAFIKSGFVVSREELYSSRTIGSYLPIDDEFFIGATLESDEASVKLFLNHSCEPNCAIRGEISFVTLRGIAVGEELTCDYATIDNEDYEFACKCGASGCRRKVTGFDWRNSDLQVKYSGHFARYLADKIANGEVG